MNKIKTPTNKQLKPRLALIAQVLRVSSLNKRRRTSHTKTKGEVQGGGRKPWRQKGTGRARAGSIRSPLWRGGGVTFGPRSTKYGRLKVNLKMKKNAYLDLLKYKIKSAEIKPIKPIKLAEPKTRLAVKYLQDNNLLDQKVLIILGEIQPETQLAFSNLANVKIRINEPPTIDELVQFKNILVEPSVFKRLTKNND